MRAARYPLIYTDNTHCVVAVCVGSALVVHFLLCCCSIDAAVVSVFVCALIAAHTLLCKRRVQSKAVICGESLWHSNITTEELE